MGLTVDMRQAMDRWLETAKTDLMRNLESLCQRLEDKLLKTVEELETRVERLEGENGALRQRVEAIDRYNRSDSLEIHNLPLAENENVEDQLINMANVMGIKMAPSDISTAYRLPLKKEKIRKSVPCLYVKFTRRNM